jgi:hypothetical protein
MAVLVAVYLDLPGGFRGGAVPGAIRTRDGPAFSRPIYRFDWISRGKKQYKPFLQCQSWQIILFHVYHPRCCGWHIVLS